MPWYAPRWNRPIGLVNRVNVPIKPIIGSLTRSADKRSGQHKSNQHNVPIGTDRRTRRDRATRKSPHWRKPGDGLEQRCYSTDLRHFHVNYFYIDILDCQLNLTLFQQEMMGTNPILGVIHYLYELITLGCGASIQRLTTLAKSPLPQRLTRERHYQQNVLQNTKGQ